MIWIILALACALQCVMVIILLMQKEVLDRMKRLATSLVHLGDDGDSSGRVQVTGEDELGQIEVSINRMLDARQASQERIERLRRLQTAGTMAAGIAHEINNPLNVIQLNASGLAMFLADREQISTDEITPKLNAITREIDKVREIIQHMRALSRGESTSAIEPTSILPSVRQALRLIQTQLDDDRIALNDELTDGLPQVFVVPIQLEQVVLNLVSNARQAMLKDKTVSPAIHLTAKEKGELVRLSIVDNGPGPGDDIERLFDPFYSTTDSGQGLGLSVVQSLVTQWGGRVEVNPVDAGGTRVCVLMRKAEVGSRK